jgi:hypothetical protein
MRASIRLPDGRTLAAEADPALESDARAFLARLAAPAAGLQPGETSLAEWDWVRVRLRASATTVIVTEADEADGAPIDLTLQQLAFQAQLLERLGAVGRPLQPGQYSRVAVDAFDAAAVVAERADDPDPLFSGWQVSAAVTANDVYGQYTTQELAEARRLWLPALALPPGWSWRIDGNVLTQCRPPDGAVHRLDLQLPGKEPDR